MPAVAAVSARDTDPAAERALIERARSDPDALAALYRLHVRAVHAFAYRRTGSVHLADEVTSATFERAVRSLPRFEWRGVGIRPWLLRIAANEVVELARRADRERGRRGQLALRDLVAGGSAGATADDGADDRWERRDAMQRALDRLSPRFREVIELRYLAGCSAEDAAAALGCSRNTLAAVLHRALRALRREIDRESDQHGGAT